MATRTIGKAKRTLAKADVKRFAQHYVDARKAAELMQAQVDDMKAALVQAVQDYGYTDDKGNQFLDIGIEGCDKLKREVRRSKRFDVTKATQWLKKQGRYDEFTEVVVQLDEDKILAASFEGDLPEKVVAGFYQESETMAFKVMS